MKKNEFCAVIKDFNVKGRTQAKMEAELIEVYETSDPSFKTGVGHGRQDI